MTEGDRIEAHRNAHDSQEHRKIETIGVIDQMQKEIRQAEQYLTEGRNALADLARQRAYDYLNDAVATGHLVPAGKAAFEGRLKEIYEQLHGKIEDEEEEPTAWAA